MRSQSTTRHRAAAICVKCCASAIAAVPEMLERSTILGFIAFMKTLISLASLILVSACASHSPYGPATSSGAAGYTHQKIETGRYRVSYTDKDPGRAHDLALLRAAELTLQDGNDWFEITGGYTDQEAAGSESRSSVSVGGSRGSYGSGVGVGVGFGIPVGSSSAKVTTVIDIVSGKNPKPDRPSVYDARSVDINLRGTAP
jgi:hypothetical protein